MGVLVGVAWLFLAAVASAQPPESDVPAPVSPRSVEAWSEGWRFHRGPLAGAEAVGFDDASWVAVRVPHDFSITGPFDAKHPSGGAGAFLPGDVAWYRRTFRVPAGRRALLELDGAMANSEVWINGVSVGRRPNGYVAQRFDITPHLVATAGADNVVAVRVDTSAQPASRWYAGAGLFRPVRLVLTQPVLLEPDATVVTTPVVTGERAVVRVRAVVRNTTAAAVSAAVSVEVRDPVGKPMGIVVAPSRPVAPGATTEFVCEVPVARPRLWDVDTPHLYRAWVRAETPGTVVDQVPVPFGIREARFEAATGFWLNGRNLKIRGVCLHEDGGAFGMAVPPGVLEQRLAQLRGLGVNAIRVAHHPFGPAFYDLCDRLGFLVMDEVFDVWTVAKRKYDYAAHFPEWSDRDLRETIRAHRNHPSIILYSAGNEIRDTPQAEKAKAILARLVATYHEEDPTRPVTQGLFRPNASGDYTNGLADLLDVVGQNYREKEILAAHAQKPTRKIIGTENNHDRVQWLALRDHPELAGQFLWTGVDYLGEADNWPSIAEPYGLIDRTGVLYPKAYERQSWWTEAPMVHATRRVAADALTPTDPGWEPDARHRQVLFTDWTPKSLEAHEELVEVYSNCAEVDLVLNGTSLGRQSLPADASPRQWRVPFARGTLEARGYAANGRVVATHVLRTAGPAAGLVIEVVPRAKGAPVDAVRQVRVTVVDAAGERVPDAAVRLTFSVDGPGAVVAVDNGDNASHEPFQATTRTTYQGRASAWVQGASGSGDAATITVRAPSLPEATGRL